MLLEVCLDPTRSSHDGGTATEMGREQGSWLQRVPAAVQDGLPSRQDWMMPRCSGASAGKSGSFPRLRAREARCIEDNVDGVTPLSSMSHRPIPPVLTALLCHWQLMNSVGMLKGRRKRAPATDWPQAEEHAGTDRRLYKRLAAVHGLTPRTEAEWDEALLQLQAQLEAAVKTT